MLFRKERPASQRKGVSKLCTQGQRQASALGVMSHWEMGAQQKHPDALHYLEFFP